MKTILTFILILGLLSTAVVAIDIDSVRSSMGKFDMGKAPASLRFLLGSPRMNINIESASGVQVYGIKIAGNKVQDIVEGGVEKPQYEITLSEETMNKLMQSSDPANALVSLYQSGEITITPVSMGARMKFWLASKFMGLGKKNK